MKMEHVVNEYQTNKDNTLALQYLSVSLEEYCDLHIG